MNGPAFGPINPNGSAHDIAGILSLNGRIMGMMPHPERLIHINNFSWTPSKWKVSPWLKMFINAREWIN